jgi:hypothetical protein
MTAADLSEARLHFHCFPTQALASHSWGFESSWHALEAKLSSGSGHGAGSGEGPGTVETRVADKLMDGIGSHTSNGAPCSSRLQEPEFSTWKFRSCGESRRVIDHVWASRHEVAMAAGNSGAACCASHATPAQGSCSPENGDCRGPAVDQAALSEPGLNGNASSGGGGDGGGRGLRLVNRWLMPGRDEIGPAGLPCASYPSDHLALCCEYEWAG